MKKLTLSLLTLAISLALHAQVAINTDGSAANNSAMLDVKSTNHGILIPRMTVSQRATIPTPLPTGLLIFQTDSNTGFYFYNGTVWIRLTDGFSSVKKVDDLSDGKSDSNGSSIFLGKDAGFNDNGSNNGNVGIGNNALRVNSSGSGNSATGFSALYNNITGYSNVAIGTSALNSNTTRSNLVAIGDSALYNNETGAQPGTYEATYNTAVGSKALLSNTTGAGNTSLGYTSLYSNSTGWYNTVVGAGAAYQNTIGEGNTSIGNSASYNNTSGNYNTSTGFSALYDNTTGYSNVAIGTSALYSNTSRANLVAIGDSALYHNGPGATFGWHAVQNTAVGSKALYSNTIGGSNTAMGFHSLYANTSGYKNTGMGYNTLVAVVDGFQNAAYGSGALLGIVSGDNNTAIGYNSYSSGDYNNSTAIGYNTSISGSNQIHLGNTSISEIKGQVNFSIYSDGRVKTNIKENVVGLEFIKRLRPVTYHFDVDKQNSLMGITDESRNDSKYAIEKIEFSGFIAQEVEKTASELNYNFSGVQKPKNDKDLYGIKYSEFVVPLVKAVQEQQQQIESLKDTNNELQQKLSEMKLLEQRLEKLEKMMKR